LVAARISRQSAEVAADADSPAGVTRLDVEVAGEATDATSSVAAQISRTSAEVAGKVSATAGVSRLDVEVAGEATDATAAVAAQISRISAEVAISISPRAAVTRLDLEVGGKATQTTASVAAQITRMTGEVAARRGSAGTVTPLALSDDAELFMHDWADELTLRSSYSTDVSSSHVSGAEARRGLRLKPARTMDLTWVQAKEEFDAADNSRLDRLLVFLRRITDERFQVPLYCDQRELAAASLAADDTVFLDTSRGRWFTGARVAIVQLHPSGAYASHTYHLIQTLQGDRITMTAAIGVDVAAGSVILPVLDCEIQLEAEMVMQTGCLAEVRLAVNEVEGASQLPPTKSDTPVGIATHLDVPILDVDPDWTQGVSGGRSRAGIAFSSGRSRSVSPYAGRSRGAQTLRFTNERPNYWRLVELFDTRRGRLRSFWQLDPEQIWTCAQVDPTFVSIEQFGDLADVQEELEGGQVGIVDKEGNYYVRDVTTVQQVATVYRMTVSPDMPASLTADDVAIVTRARRVRFDSDEMEERWTHAGLAETQFSTIEVLEEKVVDLD
jgi:hypothetical protein